jgi:hypothetical protein
MMGKAVSIKEGAEAVLNGNSAQLTVSLFRLGGLNTDNSAYRNHCGTKYSLSSTQPKEG